MATISSPGIGSGLDVNAIVNQLMELESLPLKKVEAETLALETELSLWGQVSSDTSTFKTAVSSVDAELDFKAFTATSSDEDIFTATPSVSAAAGNYTINVSRDAEFHKKSANTAYADIDTTTVGQDNDYLTIGVGTSSFTVEVGGLTLDAIRSAINDASDNAGVTASILSTDAGKQLILTADETGSDSFLAVSYAVEHFQFEDTSSGGDGSQFTATTAYADSDTTTIGRSGDTITIQDGTNPSFNVDIGAKTLEGIRDAINNDVNNSGVTASIVSDSDGYKLVLDGDGNGSLSVTYATTANLSALFDFQDVNTDRDGDLSFTSADLDAEFDVDGNTVTSTSNFVDDVIQGITLNITGSGSADLTVVRDTSTIKSNVQGLIDGYNTYMGKLEDYDAAGSLEDDATLRSMVSQLRTTLNTAADGLTFSYLSDIGVEFVLEDKELEDGTSIKVSRLSLNEETFDSKLNDNFDDIVALFSDSTEGFGTRLDDLLDSFTTSDGLIDAKQDGINASIDRLEDQQEDLQFRLELTELQLRAEFTALDTLVATMNVTSDFLTQQLSSLPKIEVG